MAGRYARASTFMNSDEAASVIAAQGIVKHGLPLVPSGQIYYRSPLSHYLDALSILVLGDNELGWRGASLAAFGLLALLPGLLLIRRGVPALGPLWALVVALAIPIQNTAHSARMYMVYTFFCTLSVLLAVFWSPMRFNRRGVIYLLSAVAAALSHQHYVVFIPGLLVIAVADWLCSRTVSLRQFLRSPLFVAPLVALAIALLFQLGDNGNLLPNAWANTASQGMPMGRARSFLFPLEIFSDCSAIQPGIFFVCLAIVTFAWRRRLPVSLTAARLILILLIAYALCSYLLPYQLSYYVTPLWPLFYFSIFSISLCDSVPVGRAARVLSIAAFAGLAVLLLTTEFHFHRRARIFIDGWRSLTDEPSPTPRRQWEALRRFVDERRPVVISSEPEIPMPRVGHVSAHVRSYGVAAPSACSEVIDDFQPIPFAHHPCILERIIADARARSRSVLFIGARLGGTVGRDNTNYIRSKFTRIGQVDGEEIYCIGTDCSRLQTLFDAASR